MSMGGNGPEVLVTLTTDFGKVLDGLHRTRVKGESHLSTGIQVAGVRCPYSLFAASQDATSVNPDRS
jgi:hypothetical protein